ncbi:hypothetical protein AWB73_03128 [Caballeronia turbans]|jgi:hypothetical protein|nr:hypothetical protein AWB73_03128 [Caballeronia turbans]
MRRKHQRQAYAQRRVTAAVGRLTVGYNTFGKDAGGAVGAAMGQGAATRYRARWCFVPLPLASGNPRFAALLSDQR